MSVTSRPWEDDPAFDAVLHGMRESAWHLYAYFRDHEAMQFDDLLDVLMTEVAATLVIYVALWDDTAVALSWLMTAVANLTTCLQEESVLRRLDAAWHDARSQ